MVKAPRSHREAGAGKKSQGEEKREDAEDCGALRKNINSTNTKRALKEIVGC